MVTVPIQMNCSYNKKNLKQQRPINKIWVDSFSGCFKTFCHFAASPGCCAAQMARWYTRTTEPSIVLMQSEQKTSYSGDCKRCPFCVNCKERIKTDTRLLILFVWLLFFCRAVANFVGLRAFICVPSVRCQSAKNGSNRFASCFFINLPASRGRRFRWFFYSTASLCHSFVSHLFSWMASMGRLLLSLCAEPHAHLKHPENI